MNETRFDERLQGLLDEVIQLGTDWHAAGTFHPEVLQALVRHAAQRPIHFSMETGSGKSTLLLSHLSRQHLAFSVDNGNGSISAVKSSPLFQNETVTFVEGPSQRTLPAYRFPGPLQFALLDGPHAFPFPMLEYYYVYPHLEENALLVIDDINVPTVDQMFAFLCVDKMFALVEVVHNTAFFRRTEAPVFDPYGDGWWLQEYNRPDGKHYSMLAAGEGLDKIPPGLCRQLDVQRAQIDRQRLQIEELQALVEKINGSISFRLGMLATAPGRALLRLAAR